MRRALLLMLLPLLVLMVRLVLDARRDLRVGDVDALGRAARAWLPSSYGPSHAAREQLASLGRAGDRHAWSELRGSILATRWLVTPDRTLLDEADRALAHDDAELALLRNVREPSRALSVVALCGLALFLFGVARALAGASRYGLIGLLGFVLFTTGLWLA